MPWRPIGSRLSPRLSPVEKLQAVQKNAREASRNGGLQFAYNRAYNRAINRAIGAPGRYNRRANLRTSGQRSQPCPLTTH